MVSAASMAFCSRQRLLAPAPRSAPAAAADHGRASRVSRVCRELRARKAPGTSCRAPGHGRQHAGRWQVSGSRSEASGGAHGLGCRSWPPCAASSAARDRAHMACDQLGAPVGQRHLLAAALAAAGRARGRARPRGAGCAPARRFPAACRAGCRSAGSAAGTHRGNAWSARRCRPARTGPGPSGAPRRIRRRARAARAAGARPGRSRAWGGWCRRTRFRSAAGWWRAGCSRRRGSGCPPPRRPARAASARRAARRRSRPGCCS